MDIKDYIKTLDHLKLQYIELEKEFVRIITSVDKILGTFEKVVWSMDLSQRALERIAEQEVKQNG